MKGHAVSLECEACDRVFVLKASRVASGRGRFCSLECRRPADLIERFWSRVNKDGPVPSHRPDLGPCWVWTRSLNRSGYGHFGIGSGEQAETVPSHVFAWKLEHGEALDGLWVLHRCDNRACCRPSHLFLGTAQDNVDDMIAKGRQYRRPRVEKQRPGQVRGTRCHTARLTEELVKEIRLRWDRRELSQVALAKEYGVSQASISSIIRRESWAHVA